MSKLLAMVVLLGVARLAYADCDEPKTASSETVVSTYSPRPGQEKELEGLLQLKWDKLSALNVVDDAGHIIYRDVDKHGKVVVVEIVTFTDKRPESSTELDTLRRAIDSASAKPVAVRKVRRLVAERETASFEVMSPQF